MTSTHLTGFLIYILSKLCASSKLSFQPRQTPPLHAAAEVLLPKKKRKEWKAVSSDLENLNNLEKKALNENKPWKTLKKPWIALKKRKFGIFICS